MEKENLYIQMEVIMMEYGKIIKWMEKEYYIIQNQKLYMMEIG